MRILIVVQPTSEAHADAGAQFERFILAYYTFLDAGLEIVLASGNGGYPWSGWPRSHDGGESGLVARFSDDRFARDNLANTLGLDQVHAEDFAGSFWIGPVGSIWRTNDETSPGALMTRFLRAGKPVGALLGDLDVVPEGAGAGLLIIGEGPQWTATAAQAFLAALEP